MRFCTICPEPVLFSVSEVGCVRPQVVLRTMLPVVFNGVTGIYGLINALVEPCLQIDGALSACSGAIGVKGVGVEFR